MANRTYLLNTDDAYGDIPQEQELSGAILCACSYAIPVFWLALFSSDDVVLRNAPAEDGDEEAYPILQTTRDVGIERISNRLPFIRENL